MSVAELKNNLHRMVVETDDPSILGQIAALFASLRGEEDWWDTLSAEEKQRIDLGLADQKAGHTSSYDAVKNKAKAILKPS